MKMVFQNEFLPMKTSNVIRNVVPHLWSQFICILAHACWISLDILHMNKFWVQL